MKYESLGQSIGNDLGFYMSVNLAWVLLITDQVGPFQVPACMGDPYNSGFHQQPLKRRSRSSRQRLKPLLLNPSSGTTATDGRVGFGRGGRAGRHGHQAALSLCAGLRCISRRMTPLSRTDKPSVS